jgi:hypothetical protein
MTSLRSSIFAAVALAATVGSAVAQSNAQRADAFNNEGKQLMQGGQFAAASDKFRQALLLSKEGRFYFNLCVSLYQEGKLGEALGECKAVDAAGADAKLSEKTSKMIGKIKDDMRKAGFDPDAPPVDPNNNTTNPVDPNNPDNPTNPVDPNNPNNPTNPVDPNNPNNPTNPVDPNNPNNPTNPNNPNTGNPNAFVAPPPSASLFAAGAPKHAYTWTLGAELLGGSGQFGPDEVYSKAIYGFRVLGDYLIAPAKKFGVQATIGVLHTDQNDDEATLGIDVVDVGIGGYKHFCSGRTCLTPLVGASLGLMQPQDVPGDDALLAIGLRAEARVGFALGKRFEHLISIAAGAQIYTRAFDSSGIDAQDYSLDGASRAFVAALGYTYRFNTPFGSSPFVTLE